MAKDRRRNPNRNPRLQRAVVHGRFTEDVRTLLSDLADVHRCSMAECMRKGIELLAEQTPAIAEAREAEARRLEEEREAEARREEKARKAILRKRRRVIAHLATPEGQEGMLEYERQHGPLKTRQVLELIHGDEERYIQTMLRQSRGG